jgi:hypothetical protein
MMAIGLSLIALVPLFVRQVLIASENAGSRPSLLTFFQKSKYRSQQMRKEEAYATEMKYFAVQKISLTKNPYICPD